MKLRMRLIYKQKIAKLNKFTHMSVIFKTIQLLLEIKKITNFIWLLQANDTETMNNKVEILDLNLKKPNDGLSKINEFKHSFPPTKMMWIPDYEGNRKDILATTAEFLRIWEI